MNGRVMRIGIAVAFVVLALLALVGVGGTVVDPRWRPFPPEVMAAAGVGLAALASVWLLSARQPRPWLRTAAIIGGALGVLVSIFGVWGTAQILGDFCSPPQATAALAASLPPLSCADVAPSIAVGCYLIAVGVVAVTSLAILARHNPAYE